MTNSDQGPGRRGRSRHRAVRAHRAGAPRRHGSDRGARADVRTGRGPAANTFDVVLTDIEMPGMSGLDLLGQLRDHAARHPGRRDDRVRQRGLRRRGPARAGRRVPGQAGRPPRRCCDTVTALGAEMRASRGRRRRRVGARRRGAPRRRGDRRRRHARVAPRRRATGSSILTLSAAAHAAARSAPRHEALRRRRASSGARLFLARPRGHPHRPASRPDHAPSRTRSREVAPGRRLHALRARPAPGPPRGPRRPPWSRPGGCRRRLLPEPVVDHRLPAHPLRRRSTASSTQAGDARLLRFAVPHRDYLEPDFVVATARYWSRFGGGRYAEPLEVIRDAARHDAPHQLTLPSSRTV